MMIASPSRPCSENPIKTSAESAKMRMTQFFVGIDRHSMIYIQPYSDLVYEHGTTRYVSTPALPENKNSLLITLSDLQVYLDQWLSWRSFVMSVPLQRGFGLLRRLRPLSRTLAFSRPLWVKRLQSSPIPVESVLATRSMSAIRRVGCGILLSVSSRSEPHFGIVPSRLNRDRGNHRHLLVQAYQPISLVLTYGASNTDFLRQHIGRRGSPKLIRLATDGRYIVSGLRTLKSAILGRTPLTPSITIQMLLLRATLSPVRGRTLSCQMYYLSILSGA